MRCRQLPPQLKKPARRLGPAALAAMATLATAAEIAVVAPPLPPLQRLSQPLRPGTEALLAMEVGGDGSGRLVFGTLRVDVALDAIALLDPDGREVWRRTPSELGRVPRAQAQQPELGDAIPLPELQQPRPGRWQLRLQRPAPALLPGRLSLSYRLLPRHALALWSSDAPLAAGQPLLLTLRPSDMGRPVSQPGALDLRVLPLQPGAAAAVLQARQDLAGPSGARIGNEAGAYFAQWRPPAAGAYELQAVWRPEGAAAPLVATRRIEVGHAAAQLRFTGPMADGPPGCVRELALGFGVQLAAPPPAGAVHSLAVRLRGTQQARLVSAGVNVSGREAAVELRLNHATLQALGWPLLRIESSQLTRIAPELQVLQVGEAVELAPLLPAAPLCR